MARDEFLFQGPDLVAVFEAQHKALRAKVDSFKSEWVLNVDENELIQSLVDEFRLDAPKLNVEGRTIDQTEEVRRIRDDFGYAFDARINVYTVAIPFTGEAVIFTFSPSSIDFNPPRATVGNGELTMTFEQRRHDSAALGAEIEDATQRIQRNLASCEQMINPFNEQLTRIAREAVQFRKQKLGKDMSVLSELGIPVRKRGTIPSTVSIPVRRKPIGVPQRTTTSSSPKVPDPTLSEGAYNQIIRTMADMALVIERNPTAFEHLSEEEIRFQFLVPLNALYEGNATAETFSYQGKTDIQIRHEGKPIFTAECKFWGGPKSLTETVDQLLTYVTWRDTKAAVLLFNKNRNFSQVLEQIEPTLRAHSRFVRFEGKKNETEYQFTISHPNDAARHITLTVLAFDIPRDN
jgi:hypothetical protein